MKKENSLIKAHCAKYGFDYNIVKSDFDSETPLNKKYFLNMIMQNGGTVQEPQQDITQIVQIFCQATGQNPEQVMAELQGASPEEQAQMVDAMMQAIQQTEQPPQGEIQSSEVPMSQYGSDSVSMLGYSDGSPYRNNTQNLIQSNEITMENTGIPLLGVSDLGDVQMMKPYSGKYSFKGNNVTEYPLAQDGGEIRKEIENYIRKGYSKQQAAAKVKTRLGLKENLEALGLSKNTFKNDPVINALKKEIKGENSGLFTEEQLKAFNNWAINGSREPLFGNKQKSAGTGKIQSLKSVYDSLGLNSENKVTDLPEVIVKAESPINLPKTANTTPVTSKAEAPYVYKFDDGSSYTKGDPRGIIFPNKGAGSGKSKGKYVPQNTTVKRDATGKINLIDESTTAFQKKALALEKSDPASFNYLAYEAIRNGSAKDIAEVRKDLSDGKMGKTTKTFERYFAPSEFDFKKDTQAEAEARNPVQTRPEDVTGTIENTEKNFAKVAKQPEDEKKNTTIEDLVKAGNKIRSIANMFGIGRGVKANQIQGDLNAYTDSFNLKTPLRQQANLRGVTAKYINPDLQVNQANSDYLNLVDNIDTNSTQGIAQANQLQTNKFKQTNQILGQVNQQNQQIQAQTENQNADIANKEQMANLQFDNEYVGKIEERDARAQEQRQNALNNIYSKMAQNEQFYNNLDLMKAFSPQYNISNTGDVYHDALAPDPVFLLSKGISAEAYKAMTDKEKRAMYDVQKAEANAKIAETKLQQEKLRTGISQASRRSSQQGGKSKYQLI